MKTVLTIAGSDSSGGAGVQADLKTFEAFGVFGTSAITVLTAQNTTGVQEIHPVPEAFVKAQIEAVLEDFPVAAIKIGMLFNAPIIETIEALLKELKGRIPVVLDPVAISRAGSILLDPKARAALLRLFDHATIATPNRHEFEHFIGRGPFLEAAEAFVRTHPCALVAKNRQEDDRSTDWLFQRHQPPRPFSTPIAASDNTHGTGCTFAAALSALLALDYGIKEATQEAKTYVYEAIKRAPGLGRGNGPIGHHR